MTSDTSHLPEKALSIRQPWAWAILNAGKRIENRPRRFHFRGAICLHASSYLNARDYSQAEDFITGQSPRWPPEMLSASNIRGGIIGTAVITDCIEESEDPWFFGPFGLVLEDVQPVPFIPVKGALGLFQWKNNLAPGKGVSRD